MKKVIFVVSLICMLCLLLVFAVSAEEYSFSEYAENGNQLNLSAIIKIFIENEIEVDVDAPFESATGEIRFGQLEYDGGGDIEFESTVTVEQLISGFDPNKYYAFGCNLIRDIRDPAQAYLRFSDGKVMQYSSYPITPVKLTPNTTVTLVLNSDYSGLNNVIGIESMMIGQFDEFYVYCDGLYYDYTVWSESADYETGYLYREPETPGVDELGVSGNTTNAGNIKPLSLIPKQADLPKVWLLIRVALIGVAGTAVLVVLFKIFRPKMRLRRR